MSYIWKSVSATEKKKLFFLIVNLLSQHVELVSQHVDFVSQHFEFISQLVDLVSQHVDLVSQHGLDWLQDRCNCAKA